LAADPTKAAGFEQAIAVALPLRLASRTRELTADEQAILDGLDAAVFRGTRELLGLDAARFAVSGAAPISTDVLEWFVAIGVPFSEIYGMSENTGPLTWESDGPCPGSRCDWPTTARWWPGAAWSSPATSTTRP
jgi:long-chain acyl-CoA synthetase